MSEKSFSELVVVGPSAGGIGGRSKLIAALPEDFPAPVFVAQHPERGSHLTGLLSRRSMLPVRTVRDEEPLEAGVVFVVPAGIIDSGIGCTPVPSTAPPEPRKRYL